ERPGKTVEEPDALQAEKDLDADEGAEDEDLGVREVDELEDAVDHRVAERDEGVHEAESDAVEKYLRKDPDQKLDVHILGRKVGGGGRRGPLQLLDDLVGAPVLRLLAGHLQHEVQRLLAVAPPAQRDLPG